MVTMSSDEYDALMTKLRLQAAALRRVAALTQVLERESQALDRCARVRATIVARLADALNWKGPTRPQTGRPLPPDQ